MKINREELHEIFEGIKNKDELKFNELYNKYYKLIYGIALSILKNKENSEDVAQATFTKIYSLPKKQLPEQAEASWLYAITKNEAINYLKKVKKHYNIDEIYYMTEENEIEDIISKDAYNRIMEKLDEKDREIVSLKIISGLSFKQIAKLIEIPMGTVQWRYYKALHTIKLLITNLCISILSVGIFVLRKIRSNKNAEENSIDEENTNNQSDFIENSYREDIEQAMSSKEETNTTNVEVIYNSTTQENIEILDIGLLTIFAIFLILTIITVISIIKKKKK